MNGFWKRKLPALALAFIMVIGLMPSAIAVEPNCNHSTDKRTITAIDANTHSSRCACGSDFLNEPHIRQETGRTPATCYQDGRISYKCTVCNYTWNEVDPATGNHNFGGAYLSNADSHWQKCMTSGCTATSAPTPHRPTNNGVLTPATCTAAGYTTYTCRDCGKTYTVASGNPLGHTAPDANGKCTRCGVTVHSNHTYTGAWTTDSGYHWHVCTQCQAQVDRAAHSDANGDGRCDTCNYGMNSGTLYTVTYHTGSGTSSESVARGQTPRNTPAGPSMTSVPGAHVFRGWVSGSSTYFANRNQAFVTPGSLPVSGNVDYSAVYYLRATGQNASFGTGSAGGRLIGSDIRTQVSAIFMKLTGVNSFSSIRFTSVGGSGSVYANSSKTALGTGNYSFSDLASYVYFTPSTAGALALSYTAQDAYGNEISGTLTISGLTSSPSEILYRVAPGGTVNFRVSDFEKAYRALSGNDSTGLRYVTFTPSSNYDTFAGILRTGSRDMDRDRLKSWSFYVTNDRYGGDYALDTVNFRAEKTAKEGEQLSLSFRAFYNSSTYYDGTLRIVIDKDGQDGDVIYRVAPGGSVTFSRVDFNNAYQEISGSTRTIRYVEFDPDIEYTNFSGKLSASGHADFDRSSLSREQFNYTGSSYGDYTLDDLTFRTTSAARDGDTLEIPFWAYYNKDDFAKGTLRIIVDRYGSQDTVTLNVAPGGTTRLDKTAFNEVYRALSENNSRTISAVSFSAPDSYRSFEGKLYVRSTAMELADLTHSKTWFYYSDSRDGDYALDDLTFQTTRNSREGDTLTMPFRAYYNNSSSDYQEGTLRIHVTTAANTITYEAAPGGSADFRIDDFNRAYQTQSGNTRTIRYVAFQAGNDYPGFAGNICTSGTPLTQANLSYNQTQFYYNSTNYGTYALSSLSFRPDANARDQSTLTIPFRAYYDNSDFEEGTLKLVVNANAGGDVAYVVTPGRTVNFDRVKFDDFFRKSYSGESLSYVAFGTPGTADFPDACGTLYAGYNTSYSVSFSRNNLSSPRFYYNTNDAGRGDYGLNDLTFAAANSFTSGKVVLRFTAYGTGSHSVEGTLVITPAVSGTNPSSNLTGSVRYAVASGTSVQINANDLARFYKSTYPSGTLQYVTLGDVPAVGALYYNYYGASRYGSAAREQITASNRSKNFYLSPASPAEYALTELTYIPSGSNYCASIPFTAYGVGGQSAAGSILISVTNKTVSEVYGPTPKNTAVTFPASSMYAAVNAATGAAPTGFQLLKLPASSVGAIYVGAGTTPANTTTVYGYNTGTEQLGQLRFVPATGYTGPVEIPYVALNASNVPIASGVFSMGVLNTNKKFTDITAATWCYKYVTELADASVIDGYSNGSFRPDSTITYGAALKLIMLAAGYSEQAPVAGGGTFSGYLAKAQADGLITRSNVNLSGPITRLQVAQLAAGALKLDINNLSSVKPFTDTSDVYVQALNAAGIVEGYFNNGTSTFRPSNTLTRGQVSAIVWRMQNYRR